MLTRLRFIVAAVAVALACSVGAQTVVNQGSGSSSGTKAWRVTPVTSGGAASEPLGQAFITTGAPAARVAISGTSAAATGLTAGARYRVACDTACFFRTGSGTPTALTTDAAFYGPAVEYLSLRTGDTAIAFITSAGTGVCTISRLFATQ